MYWILMIVCFIFSLFAQFKVKSTFSKYSQIPTSNGLNGERAALKILQMNDLTNVRVEGIAGHLTDHYDPRNDVLRLSESTRYSNSIAAVGVAAHEAGHAIQDGVSYIPNKIRSSLVPVANIGSMAGPYLAMIGVMINSFTNLGMTIAYVGLILYFFAFLFYIVTLPVEFNASSRAIRVLNENQMLNPDELRGARKVLNAAAMTYVASAATALVSFLRILAIVNSGKRR